MSQLAQAQFGVTPVGNQVGILFEDEGVALGTQGTADTVNFVGAGVTATRAGNTINVTVPGGGGGIVPKTVSETKNIPADFATLTAAITYWASNLWLNESQLTVTIDAGTTLNEQITFNGVDARNLHISALGAGVTINTAGFVAGILGAPQFIYLEDAALGEITGTWTMNATVPSIFLLGLNAEMRTGLLPATAFSVTTPGDYAIANVEGHYVGYLSTLTGGSAGLYSMRGAISIAYSCTIQTVAVQAGGGINLDACTINSTTSATAILLTGGHIESTGTSWNPAAAQPTFQNINGTLVSYGDSYHFAAGATGIFASCLGGRTNVDSPTAVTGTTTGARFSVSYAALAQLGNAVPLTAATGADNVAANTPAATGLILA